LAVAFPVACRLGAAFDPKIYRVVTTPRSPQEFRNAIEVSEVAMRASDKRVCVVPRLCRPEKLMPETMMVYMDRADKG
jgi:hypothetical protein